MLNAAYLGVRPNKRTFDKSCFMARLPKTFYKYRTFNAITLESLCHDTVYFADPGAFNDPLDCAPTLECDSSVEDLRKLLSLLIGRRVRTEILGNLKSAYVKSLSASEHAQKKAHLQARQELANIAYSATNPDYEVGVEEAELWLLVKEIERELDRHYERGVCSFSTTYASPLLWSHYGDQHQGLCIGYGVDRNPQPKLEKVVYGGSRSIKTSVLAKAFIEGDLEARAELDRDVLLRKARGWNYEREWRLIGAQGIQDSPLLLKSVTFGVRCSSSIMHSVVNALSGRDNRVEFFEMYIVRGSFTLRRRSLDTGELGAHLPRTSRSGVELFGPIEEEVEN